MNGERGYTLIEMLVAMVVTGLIGTMLVLGVQQILSVPEKGNDQVAALHDMQGAAYWFGVDINSAEAASCDTTSLNLTLPDSSFIRYLWSGDMLHRYVNGVGMTLATSIDSMNFTVEDRLVTICIIEAPESRWDISENQTYKVAMRPSGEVID